MCFCTGSSSIDKSMSNGCVSFFSLILMLKLSARCDELQALPGFVFCRLDGGREEDCVQDFKLKQRWPNNLLVGHLSILYVAIQRPLPEGSSGSECWAVWVRNYSGPIKFLYFGYMFGKGTAFLQLRVYVRVCTYCIWKKSFVLIFSNLATDVRLCQIWTL